MAAESQGCRTVAYRRRHPEQTALYQVVQQHLETYLALVLEDDWDGPRVPAYVEREFRRYLRRATPGGWPRPRRIWSIRSSRRCRCASGSSRCPSGFSLDAAVCVAANDRAGLQRLLRDCARPPFALERLELLDAERVVYRLRSLPVGQAIEG